MQDTRHFSSIIASLALASCAGGAISPSAPNASDQVRSTSGVTPTIRNKMPHTPKKPRITTSSFPHGALLFISDYNNDVVDVYSQTGPNQTPATQLGGLEGPNGIAVASNGDVYVSNWDNNLVSVFHKHQTTAYESLSAIDTSYGGTDVAIAPTGIVYVGNIGGIIQVFAGTATSPTSSLTDPNISGDWVSVAADANGNVFDMGAGYSSGSTVIDEFTASSSTPTMLPIFPSGDEGGLAVDANDDLWVNDSGAGTISEYAPPYTGSPIVQFSYANAPGLGMALTKSGKKAWLAVPSSVAGVEYNLRGRLKGQTSSTGLTDPYGAAVFPPNPI
jgi:streptogramin lyase